MGRNLAPPVEVTLVGGLCTLTAIDRLLPGKRLAGRCTYQGRQAFMKLFFGRGAKRARNRDKMGVAILRDSGVHTPELLLETTTAAAGGYALLFEYLENAKPLAGKTSVAELSELVPAVAALARLNGQGALHRDPNLDNFLIDDGRLHLVDGGAIRRKRSALGETSSLKALAALLAEFPPANDHRTPALLARYASERGWPETALPSGLRQASNSGRGKRLHTYLASARRRRIRRYLAKTERNCTEFHRERNWRRLCLAKRDHWNAALAEFAQHPQAGLANAEIIKNGYSATVYRLKLGNTRVVVKRYNLKSAGHRLRRWFKHRARIAWRNGHRLAFLGIPGAQPIALIERRWGPLRAEAWVVMPDCGSLDIHEAVRTRGWSHALLSGVVRIFQDLKTAGLYHGDTKASNFLVEGDDVRLIDYDGLREHPGSKRDIARFLKNFDNEAQAHATRKFNSDGLL